MADYGWRDAAVSWLANQILRLASQRYRNMVKGSIKYGLLSAARDERTGMRPPEVIFTDGAEEYLTGKMLEAAEPYIRELLAGKVEALADTWPVNDRAGFSKAKKAAMREAYHNAARVIRTYDGYPAEAEGLSE